MEHKQWNELQVQIIAILLEAYGVNDALKEWHIVYRPILIRSLDKPGTHTMNVNGTVIEWTVKE